MKLSVDLGDELQHAMELHLETGVPVQVYLKAAMRFFRDMYKMETIEKRYVGFNRSSTEASTFERYNTIVSPVNYLNTEKERS